MAREIKLALKQDCTGCAVCHDVCPRGCITMNYGNGLHWYPVVDNDKCIQCGKCEKVCPALNDVSTCDFEQKFYASWSKAAEERKQSTSGGVGTALARYALSKGWYVVGAEFNKGWALYHRIVSEEKGLDNLRGSKYLQSNTAGIFKQLEQLVSSGKHVFFIGTPCQVESVKRIIPANKHDLITTCGIICHGVNSSKVWLDFVHYLEGKHNSGIKSYDFRSKEKGWGENSRGGKKLYVKYETDSGKTFFKPAWKNLFHHWFGLHVIMRESCFNCKYRVLQRNSDITIGDFWGLKRVLPELQDIDNGVSVAITSSPQGEAIIENCGVLNIIPVDSNKTPKVLAGFLNTRDKGVVNNELIRMKQFEKEYAEKGFDTMRQKYPTTSVFKKIIQSVMFHIGIK